MSVIFGVKANADQATFGALTCRVDRQTKIAMLLRGTLLTPIATAAVLAGFVLIALPEKAFADDNSDAGGEVAQGATINGKTLSLKTYRKV